jgi:hypothetical protein
MSLLYRLKITFMNFRTRPLNEYKSPSSSSTTATLHTPLVILYHENIRKKLQMSHPL